MQVVNFGTYNRSGRNMLKETGTGIYIAYSRSETLQVANTSPVALVNCRHTKVGFATDSFLASAEISARISATA